MNGPQETQNLPTSALMTGLTNLLDTGNLFDALTLSLFQNNATFSRAGTIADYTVADFHGYADVAGLTFTGPFIDADGTVLALGADNAFIATTGGSLLPQTIYGYTLSTVARAALVAAYFFDTPVPIAVVGNAVIVVPYLRYSGT